MSDGKVIKELQDLTWLEWGLIRATPGTVGTFLKSYYYVGDRKIYCKLSSFDPERGTVGHECVNELIADRLLTLLGIEHLAYTLVHANIKIENKIYETWLTTSEDFKAPLEDKIAFETYYKNNAYHGEDAVNFFCRSGWGQYLWNMLICDFLILNRDRHGANIEVLRNRRSGAVRLAPLFDNGQSLLFSCHTDADVVEFDIRVDRKIQSVTGKTSALENLKLIPKDDFPKFNPLREPDKEYLFKDLELAISPVLANKIWDFILWRREYIENFGVQR